MKENECLFKNNQLLENQLRDKEFKLTTRSFLTEEKVHKNNTPKITSSRTTTPIPTSYSKEKSDFGLNAIKSFSSFSLLNNSTNIVTRMTTPNTSSELEFYKKKCSVLENNIQELTQKYNQELIYMKTKILEKDSEEFKVSPVTNKISYLSREDSGFMSKPTKKKTLSPLSKSSNTPYKIRTKYNY